jgi:hypothetical protein
MMSSDNSFPLDESTMDWLGGVADTFGSVTVRRKTDGSPYRELRFKTVHLDRLEVIQGALGGMGALSGPIPPGKNQKQEQWCLTLTGVALVVFENVVVSRMRTARRHAYFDSFEKWRKLRKKHVQSRQAAVPS